MFISVFFFLWEKARRVLSLQTKGGQSLVLRPGYGLQKVSDFETLWWGNSPEIFSYYYFFFPEKKLRKFDFFFLAFSLKMKLWFYNSIVKNWKKENNIVVFFFFFWAEDSFSRLCFWAYDIVVINATRLAANT